MLAKPTTATRCGSQCAPGNSRKASLQETERVLPAGRAVMGQAQESWLVALSRGARSGDKAAPALAGFPGMETCGLFAGGADLLNDRVTLFSVHDPLGPLFLFMPGNE